MFVSNPVTNIGVRKPPNKVRTAIDVWLVFMVTNIDKAVVIHININEMFSGIKKYSFDIEYEMKYRAVIPTPIKTWDMLELFAKSLCFKIFTPPKIEANEAKPKRVRRIDGVKIPWFTKNLTKKNTPKIAEKAAIQAKMFVVFGSLKVGFRRW